MNRHDTMACATVRKTASQDGMMKEPRHGSRIREALRACLLVTPLFLIACTPFSQRSSVFSERSESPVEDAIAKSTPAPAPSPVAASRQEMSGSILESNAKPAVAANAEIFTGSGRYIRPPAAQAVDAGEGNFRLNFENTPLPVVIETILGEIMKVNYVINSAVAGSVSIRTTKPIGRDALIPTLDNLLRSNGAALIKTNDFYEVVPIDDGAMSRLAPSTRLSADRGYQMLVVPLEYIGAREMHKILEPLKSAKTTISIDESRNMLTLVGTQGELFNFTETIAMFDVDQLEGKSVGLFRLQHVTAEDIVEELESVLGAGEDGPLAGMLNLSVIERLNALLVITSQDKYLSDVSQWIRRLDVAEDPQGMGMYVYYVQNGKAENIADLLTQLFDGKRRRAIASEQGGAARAPSAAAAPQAGDKAGASGSRGKNARVSSIETGDVSIIADNENNSLLILASPSDYAEVEKAVERLDVLPMQVLVEASIVEVTLGGELEYGLQWFFQKRHNDFDHIGGLGVPANGVIREGGLGGALPNPVDFTYAVFDAATARVVLNALAGDSRIEVLSSPSLLVLDNQKATIRVGDQVPIRTSETSYVGNPVIADTNTNVNDTVIGNNVTSTIEYRDTGVTLEIKPRVNSGGMVILDITQRVDDVDETTTSSIDSPTILQREIKTIVAVQSGETIMLGGLIREGKEKADNGIPFLKDIPVLGLAFGSKRVQTAKTELVVMITPSAIANSSEARDVTAEYNLKLKNINLSGKK